MVNKVKIYNEENQYLSVVQNDELVGSFISKQMNTSGEMDKIE